MRTQLRESIVALLLVVVLACAAVGCSSTGGSRSSATSIVGQRAITVNVRQLGAKGDGLSDDSPAIRAAIDKVATRGSGTVQFPPGDYLTGPIELASHMTLKLDRGATLRFSTDPQLYPPTLTRWEGTECYNFSPLMHGKDLTDIAIAGEGTIDGQGRDWWDMRRNARPAVTRLRKMAQDGTPVEERRFATVQDGLRPTLIEFWQCSNVTVEGVTIQQSPFWTVHPVYCTDVTLRNLTIRGDGPNTDGIDPDSCQRVRIDNCDIATGDDSIAIKSGRDSDGRRVNRPTTDVQITNCRFAKGHSGVAIGSETSGGVSDVVIRDCTSDGNNVGILVKTMRGRGGVIENITAERITLKNVKRDGVMISMRYNTTQPEPVSERTPTVRNVTFRDIKGTSNERAGRFTGLEERAVENVRLENVVIAAKEGFAATWTDRVTFAGVSLKLDKGPAIECADSSALIVNGLALQRPVSASPLIRLADVRGFALRNVPLPEDASVVTRATGTVTDMNVGAAKVVRDPVRDPLEITAATQPYGGNAPQASPPTAAVSPQQ
jgi:polygalacturonase